MKVTHRLYFAFLPSAVGVVTVAALGYWGQYSRTVPELFLVIAVMATIGTLVMSWMNVRYVAKRVERLSRRHSESDTAASASHVSRTGFAAHDELDTIEGVVSNLAEAAQSAQFQRDDEARRYDQTITSYASMLSDATAAATRELDEVRLPLHILLENRFGDLNENQEEMLEAARAAAEVAHQEFATIKQIAELDLDRRELRRDRIFMADLWHAIVPMLNADAEKRGIKFHAEIPALIPAILGDAAQLQEAFLTLARDIIASLTPERELRVALTTESGLVRTVFASAVIGRASTRTMLALRLVVANRGTVEQLPDSLTVSFRI